MRISSFTWNESGDEIVYTPQYYFDKISYTNIEREKCTETIEEYLKKAYCVSWMKDGKGIAIGLINGLTHIWDVEKGICLDTIPGHKEPVTDLEWDSLCDMIAIGYADGRVQILS